MPQTTKDRLIVTGLIALSLVPALAGTARLAQLTGGAEITQANARFFASPVPVLLHIPAAILFSMLGAFQFAPGFRRRRRAWHRYSGRALVPLGVIVALTGLWMAHFYPWPVGDGLMVYIERLLAGVSMLTCLAFGVNAIRTRAFAAHGEWMMRAYALALGAGTQVLTHLPWFMLVDRTPGELPRGIMMGAGWVINVAFAEWIIRRTRHALANPRSPRCSMRSSHATPVRSARSDETRRDPQGCHQPDPTILV